MTGLDPKAVQQLTHAFVLGTARNVPTIPAALSDAAPAGTEPAALQLAALALLAQRSRLGRSYPVVPRPAAREALARRVVPDALRSDVAALLSATSANEARADPLIPRTLALLRSQGIRLHPFDLGRVRHATAAWPQHVDSADRTLLDLDAADAPDDETWMDAPQSARAAFFRARRMRDPDAARALLAAALETGPAARTRAQLVPLLAERLSAEDLDLLEGLVNDRSSTVREVATRLLGRIPGTAAYAARLERATDHFTVRRAGLLRGKRLGYRNTLSDETTCVDDTFGLRLDDLARALELGDDPGKWPKLADDVAEAFAVAALLGGDVDRFARLYGHADPGDWDALLTVFVEHGLAVDPEILTAALTRIPPGPGRSDDGPLDLLAEVYASDGGSLPDPLADALLRGRPGARLARDAARVAALLPASAHTAALPVLGDVAHDGSRVRRWFRLNAYLATGAGRDSTPDTPHTDSQE